jgi:hypothetical protein
MQVKEYSRTNTLAMRSNALKKPWSLIPNYPLTLEMFGFITLFQNSERAVAHMPGKLCRVFRFAWERSRIGHG